MYIHTYTGGPLSLRQQCMIKIRGSFKSGVVDKLPLPEVMKKEINTIPRVHCEYQHVDGESRYDSQSTDPETDLDPLAQSRVLIAKGTCSKRNLMQTIDVDKSSNVFPQKNSTEDSKTEISPEIVSQSPTAIQPSPVRNKTKNSEIQVH